MRACDPMNFFPFALLIEGDGSQDGSQDHARPMNPGESLVNANLASTLRSRNPGRANREVSAHEIQISRSRAQGQIQITVGRTGASAAGAERSGDRGN